MTTVNLEGANLYVRVPFNELDLIKARNIPQRRWVSGQKAWSCRPSLANMTYIQENWPDADWGLPAAGLLASAQQEKIKRDFVRDNKRGIDLTALDGTPFKRPPLEHQKRALLLGRDMPYFAYLMDQGTGKTKTILDDAAHNWRQNKIDALLVVAPNSVKMNWVSVDEVDAVALDMAPDVPVIKAVWVSQMSGADRRQWDRFEAQLEARENELIVLAINYEALIVPRLYSFLAHFCQRFRTMMALDESTRIKSPGAARTKAANKLRRFCHLARIASGTPIIKSPMAAYSQFSFLDEDILGFGSFYSFRNHFAIMGGFEGRQVINYKNLEELSASIASCSFRVTKDECLDLPPKVYQKRRVTMTDAQVKAYKQMREEMLAETADGTLTAPIVLTQMLRLQQITGGYMTDGEKVFEIVPPDKNPKLQEAMDILAESGDQQVIIWCRFRAEIAAMAGLLKKEGISYVEFHGGVSERDRIIARSDFQTGKAKVLIGNTDAGGVGLDLFAASVVIYVSNSFATEQRVQSEDRAHRIGSERHAAITYYDLMVPNTVDVKIVQTLRSDKRISDEVMRDGLREWI
jgi:SNF2 family DNA or RNA helicase